MNLLVQTLSVVSCLCAFSFVSTAESVEVSQDKKSEVQQEENKMSEVSQVRASHILVSAEQEAKDLLVKIKNGDITFEDAAKESSKCPSKVNGGDLGFFGKNMMVKEFETAAFSLNVGDISEPVKTQFGWHLIKVTAKK